MYNKNNFPMGRDLKVLKYHFLKANNKNQFILNFNW